MLKKIKSSIVLQKIFLNLSEQVKLNSILYNKNLQYKLNKDIIDFRKLSGRYIIGERTGKGREYSCYDDNLLFEGEYLNGKRHGLGKQYNDKQNLIFEGK